MAVTLTTSWQNVAHWQYAPNTGFKYTFYLDAKYSTQSTDNNTTTIQTRLNGTVDVGWGNGYNYSFSCSYAPTVSGSGLWNLETETITSGEGTITHNEDGTKSLTLSSNVSISGMGMYGSLSGDVILPTINRYAKTTEVTGTTVSTDVYNPESTFKVKYTKYIDTYKYKLRVDLINGSTTTTLETVDYNTSNANYNMSSTAKTAMYNGTTTTNDFKLGFAVETYNSAGTTKLSSGNTKQVNCKLQSANPTFSTISFDEATTANGGLGTLIGSSANAVKVVKNYSTIDVTITSANKAVGNKGASIVRYEATSGTKSATANYSSDSTVTIRVKDVDGSSLVVRAIDSRGNSTAITKNSNSGFTVVTYNPVKKTTYTVARQDDVSETVKLAFTGTFTATVNSVTNSLSVKKYRYRKVGASSWTNGGTTLSPTTSSNNITIASTSIKGDTTNGFDQNYSYEVQLQLADKIMNAKGSNYYYQESITIGAGSPALAFSGNSLGIGMPYDESTGGRIQINKNVKVYDGSNFIDLFVD